MAKIEFLRFYSDETLFAGLFCLPSDVACLSSVAGAAIPDGLLSDDDREAAFSALLDILETECSGMSYVLFPAWANCCKSEAS